MFLHLIDENKELQKHIKDIDLMLKKVLEQQSLNVNKLHGDAKELLLQNDSQAPANNSTHTSKEEELVKPFWRVKSNDETSSIEHLKPMLPMLEHQTAPKQLGCASQRGAETKSNDKTSSTIEHPKPTLSMLKHQS